MLPVVRALVAEAGVPVSIDTMRAGVGGGRRRRPAPASSTTSAAGWPTPTMARAVAALEVPYVVMHWRGHSADMDSRAVYDDVVADVVAELEHGWSTWPRRASTASASSSTRARLRQEGRAQLGAAGPPRRVAGARPAGARRRLAQGLPRRAARRRAAATPRPADRRADATTALTALLAARGAWAVRVHDVAGSADAVRVVLRSTPSSTCELAALDGRRDATAIVSCDGPAGARGHHGVYPRSARPGQTFVVDVVLDVDTRQAADSRRRGRHRGLRRAGRRGRRRGRGRAGRPDRDPGRAHRRRVPVPAARRAVEVTVHKPEAPVGVPFDDVAVTIVRDRAMSRRARQRRAGLGSNIGDRLAMLQGAVDALSDAGRVVAVSPVYETDPVGGPEQADFLNAVVVVETDLDGARPARPAAHAVEARFARARDVRWGPRTLDVDLAHSGTRSSTTPTWSAASAGRGARLRTGALVGRRPRRDVPGRAPGERPAGRPRPHGVRVRPDLTLRLPAVGRA